MKLRQAVIDSSHGNPNRRRGTPAPSLLKHPRVQYHQHIYLHANHQIAVVMGFRPQRGFVGINQLPQQPSRYAFPLSC